MKPKHFPICVCSLPFLFLRYHRRQLPAVAPSGPRTTESLFLVPTRTVLDTQPRSRMGNIVTCVSSSPPTILTLRALP